MSWKKKGAIIAGTLIILYTISGFLIIPLVAESILPDKLNELTKRPASIKNISLNPYTLAISLEGLDIKEKDREKSFVAFDKFFVNMQWSSLFQLSPVSSEMRLENPQIRISRVSGSEFNFSDLLASEGDKEGDKQVPEKREVQEPLRFSFSNIAVSNGTIIFHDAPMDKTHRFAHISFELPRVSNFEAKRDTYSEPLLSSDFNGTELKIDADTKPFADTLNTVIDISLSNINLPRYFDYVPVPLGFAIAKGMLDIKSSIMFEKGTQGENQLGISGTADFSNLKLVDTNSSELLFIPALHLKMAPSQPLQKNVRIESLVLTEPELTLVRQENGRFNLSKLGPATDNTNKNKQEEQYEQKNGSSSGDSDFIFQLSDFQLDSGKVMFRDFAAPTVAKSPQGKPVQMQLAPVNLEVSNFSNQPENKADLDLSAGLNPNATLSAAGNFKISPLTADLDISLEDLKLNKAQSYCPQQLQLVLSEGVLNLSGDLGIQANTANKTSVKFNGNTAISDMKVVEANTSRELTTCRSFDLKGIDFSWNPTRLNLDQVSIRGLGQNVVVEKDGELNLNQVYKKDPTKEEGKEEAKRAGEREGAPFPMSVEKVSLSDINLAFADYSISPNYTSRLTLKQGQIKGLSTKNFQGADISMQGVVNKHAPFNISGRINPLLKDIMLDLHFDLQNLELSPLTSYSGKYIGRAIEKGKLNLDLDYVVKQKKLKAENKLLLNQFNLGRNIKSDSATNMPVGLAVALLKDRNGKINLDLPLSGRLDDPQFSLTGIVFKTFKNIVVKAATSPFSLVSSIVSGGEELRYVEFQPGKSKLTDTAEKKLESMQKLLYKRPQLNLELAGFVDKEKDRQAMIDKALKRRIRAAKWSDKSRNEDEKATRIEDIKISEEKYPEYLQQVYKDLVLSGKETPDDVKPLSNRTLTVEKMREKIKQRMSIGTQRLRLLVQERINAVKDFILRDENISGKRLFINETEFLSPQEPKGFSSSRVEIDLG